MLFVMAGIISMVALGVLCGWYYSRNLDWQIKLVSARLNKIIRTQSKGQGVQRVLKRIYVIIYSSMAADHSVVVYQSLDLLKLSFGHGFLRPRESARVMAVCVTAMRHKKPDTVSLALDVFRILLRQLPPEEVPSAVDQLTLIAAMALKQKYNFLAAKVIECIFSIMEQNHGTMQRRVLVASMKSLQVIGVLVLRRRDMALFRELTVRLSGWLLASQTAYDVADEIVKMLSAWLYRIVGQNNVSLFVVMTDFINSMVENQVLSEEGLEVFIVEWGDVAAFACLNPNSPLTGLIIEFMFTVVKGPDFHIQWLKVLTSAVRVAKLAVHRRGLIAAFSVVAPILEVGRKLLWAELKFVEYVDELHQQQLFRVVRECLSILNYTAKQDLIGSTGETIIELFTYWVEYLASGNNQKSIKKYCQLLLLCWLKNKRQAKRYMPRNVELIQPMLFSPIEKRRLGL